MKTFNTNYFPISKVKWILPFLFLLFVSNVFAQVLTYSNSWGPNGMTLNRQSQSGIEVNFSISQVNFVDVLVDGMTMKSVTIPGVFLPNQEGYPDLAGTSRFIMIPEGAKATFRIISSRIEKIKDIEIAPAPRIPKDNEPGPMQYSKNFAAYGKNQLYPENPVQLSEVTEIRGVDIVVLGITPFQYNPATKELTIYRDMKIEVNFTGGNNHFGNDAFRSRWFDPILSDAVLNSASLPKIDYGQRNIKWQKQDAYGYEYIIICPNVPIFLQWADSIKNFRIAQGIKTGIFTLTQIGGNDPTLIKTFLTNAWNNWAVKPVAALMLGDYNPPDAGNAVTSPIYNSYCVSDNILGDINNNQLPDIIMARMTAQDATQLQTMITKFLNYEKNPPTDANYYLKPITALGWQTERWFQLCSEIVGGFWKKKMNKLPTRINAIYSGSPTTVWSTNQNTQMIVDYFGPAGTYYIPLTPDSLGGWSGGTAQMVVNAINGGSFALQHRDHGSETGWGEPAFQSSNIDQLTNNNNNLCFIFSINCLTGKYNISSESFAEKFHRYRYNSINAGALGLIAASEVSYSFVNDAYVWGMMDNFWPKFMPTYGETPSSRDVKPAFGNAAGKYFLYSSSWPYNTSNKEVTYHLFHHHSDAFLNLYANVPTNLNITHAGTIATGVTTFNVTVDSGAFVALTIDTTILGTGTSTGTALTLNIPGTQVPGQIMKVVATKQDKFRYTANVQVIPNSGPYVIKDSVAINDATPLGNGNGQIDYGETNKLALRIKNVGSVIANNVNVKVTTTDTYITMTDSVEVYGNINAGATMLKTDAFTYTVANTIPDNRVVNFTVTATSGADTWLSYFSFTAHSPVLKYANFAVNDSAGNNNGRWDAGETVALKIKARNSGSSAVSNVLGVLSETDPYISIVTNNMNYGNIAAGDSAIKSFNVSALANTPVGYQAKIKITLTGNLGISCVDSFYATIGQNVAIIGNGTTACGYPFYTYYMDSKTQMLYTSAEILASGVAAGYVTRIGFDVTTAASQVMNGFMVKMKNFVPSSLSTFETTGMSTVYAPPAGYTVPGTGWRYIDLTSPFQWNGTNNLLIEICFNNTSYTANSTVNGTPNSLNQLKHQHQDISAGDGCVLITAPSASYTARPNISLTINAVIGINNGLTGIPEVYSLSQNYPNPFNPITKINFAVPKENLVNIKVYDVLGREIITLVNDVRQPGFYSVDFDGTNMASGIYYYRMESGAFTDVKKLMLIK